MKFITIPALACTLLSFYGCSGPDTETTGTAAPGTATSTSLTDTATRQPAAQPSAPGTQQAAPVAQQSGAVNPPHGQPGHRCEIAVGAPLTSAPQATQAAPQVSPAATPTFNAPAAPATGSTAAGINPPHGQPGHDCSVAVGSPLKK